MDGVAQATVRSTLAAAVARLGAAETGMLDAQLLLAHALGRTRTWLYAWPDAVLEPAALEHFETLLQARVAGQPVAYLTGTREFWSLELQVDPGVLIPRPETELLVQSALELTLPARAVVADLGTGSGAIALALATERPAWQIHAVDSSAAALEVAGRNVAALGLHNVSLLQGSWCALLPAAAYDLIISNPPYIAADDPHLQQGDLRFEPQSALVATGNGLDDISCIAGQARDRLVAGGWLLLEHGWKQGEAVRALLQQAGYVQVQTRHDLGQQERVTMGRKP
jgi:release factor glutamine methyltransferase